MGVVGDRIYVLTLFQLSRERRQERDNDWDGRKMGVVSSHALFCPVLLSSRLEKAQDPCRTTAPYSSTAAVSSSTSSTNSPSRSSSFPPSPSRSCARSTSRFQSVRKTMKLQRTDESV